MAPTKRNATKAATRRPAPKRVPVALRQRALELAVSVSGVSYSGGYNSGMSGMVPETKRKNSEDAATILATAKSFLDFMNA